MRKPFFVFLVFLLLNLVIITSLVIIWRPAWNIGGDGMGYYSYFRSLYFDHDLDFQNEFSASDRFTNFHLTSNITPAGYVANMYSVGPAIFWSPFLVAASAFGEGGSNQYGLTGYGPNFQVAIFFATIFYLLIGLSFLFWALCERFGLRIAFVTATAVWLISPLLHYVLYEPSMSHVLSFAALAALFYVYLRRFDNSAKKTILLGLLVGISALIRWQNIIFILVPLAFLLFDRYILFYQRIKNLFYLVIACFIVFLPQLFVWHYLYGSWLALPQGSSFLQPLQPHILEVLFSGYHGLFFWHPLLLLGVLGLLLYFRMDRKNALLFILLLAIVIYVNAGLSDWMGGRAFGGRRFIGILFVFAWGLAVLQYYLQTARRVWSYLFSLLLLLGIIWNITLDTATARALVSLDAAVSPGDIWSGQLAIYKQSFWKIYSLITRK